MKKFDKQICLFGLIVWIIYIAVSIVGWATGETPHWAAVIIPCFGMLMFYADAYLRMK